MPEKLESNYILGKLVWSVGVTEHGTIYIYVKIKSICYSLVHSGVYTKPENKSFLIFFALNYFALSLIYSFNFFYSSRSI